MFEWQKKSPWNALDSAVAVDHPHPAVQHKCDRWNKNYLEVGSFIKFTSDGNFEVLLVVDLEFFLVGGGGGGGADNAGGGGGQHVTSDRTISAGSLLSKLVLILVLMVGW